MGHLHLRKILKAKQHGKREIQIDINVILMNIVSLK